MKLLFLAIAALALSLIATLSVIISLTYHDRQNFAFLFTSPNGNRCEVLCLFGIKSGSTTLSDAYDILEANPFLKNTYVERLSKNRSELDKQEILRYESSLNSPVSLTLIADRERTGSSVNYVSLTLHKGAPTLGEMIIGLGRPNSVFVQKGLDGNIYGETIAFIRGEHVYLVNFDTLPDPLFFNPLQRSTYILLARITSVEDLKNEQIPWVGFASYEHYIAEHKKLHPR